MNLGEKRRILGEMLNKYIGKEVCILGTFMERNPNGKSFKLKTTDQQTVVINLNSPLQEYVDGWIEIEGRVDNDSTISCIDYSIPPMSTEANPAFSSDLYNKVVKLMDKHPSHY